MNFSTHLSFETLVSIAEEQATLSALGPAVTHLSTCTDCAETLARLKQLIHAMRTDHANDAPHDVVNSALDVFPRGNQTALKRVFAILRFDSRNAGATLGTRSLHASTRQLLYSAQDTDVDLRVAVQNEECVLAGQIIGPACLGGQVSVVGSAGSAVTTLNELCEFTLPIVPVGIYSLFVRMHDTEIEIPELELKA